VSRPPGEVRPGPVEPLLLLSLAGLHPFVSFTANNVQEGVRLADVAGTAGITLAAILGVYGVLLAALRPQTLRLSAICAVAVMLLFSEPAVSGALAQRGWSPEQCTAAWLALSVLGVAVAAWAGSRTPFHHFLVLFAAGRLALPLFAIASELPATGISREARDAAYPLRDNDIWSGRTVQTPNLYWLVFDSYPNARTLREHHDFDNAEMLAFLESRGFRIATDSHANFNKTKVSMTTALNMEYTYGEDDVYAEILAETRRWLPGATRTGLAPAIAGDNRSVSYLQQAGYRYVHYDNRHWEIFRCRGYEDICLVAEGDEPREFELGLRTLFPPGVRNLLAWANRAGERAGAASTGIPEFADALEGLERGAPIFVYAHFGPPHSPFRHDARCQLLPEPEYDARYFANELGCVNRQLRELVDGILSRDPEAWILVSGDHGPRLLDPKRPIERLTRQHVRERLGILAALRLPEACAAFATPSTSPVNFMRIVFACLGGHAPRLLNDAYFIVASNMRSRDFGVIRRVAVAGSEGD
jgi:hypothetical protein